MSKISLMFATLFAALLVAAGGLHVHLVDDGGAPIAGAVIVFRSASGAEATAVTNSGGDAVAPEGFAAATLRIRASGFTAMNLSADVASIPIVLQRAPVVIGSVRVATGSARNLHRLAVPAATLDRTALAATPAYATDTVLRALPGFDFVRSNSAFTNYGNLRVSFSGAGEDRGLVFADDVPAQDGFGGQVDWLAYPPAGLDSVELLRGPGAALYGANAIGGVLQLRTFAPASDWRALPGGSLDLSDGTPHRTNAAANYRFTLAPNVTAALTTQTGHQAYYDLPPGYASAADREATASSSATRAQVRYAFGRSSIDLGTLFANDAQFEGRPSYTFARALSQTDIHFAASAGRTSIGVSAYDRNTTIVNTNDQAPAAPGVLRYVQRIPTQESGVAATWFSSGAYNEVALRADERFVSGISTQTGPAGLLQSSGSGRQQYAGAALEDTFERGRFQLIGGLRADLVTFSDGALRTPAFVRAPTRDDRVLSPRLAARYDLTRSLALRASTGGGFREPFLNELLRGYRIGNAVYTPNPNLTPERSRSYGFGADAIVGSGRLALDIASTAVNNAIEFVTTAPNSQIRSNVARTQTDGTTLTYTAAFSGCTRLRAYATTQYGRIVNGPAGDIGNRLQYVPSRSADVAVDSGSRAFGYGADVGYAGVTFADDRNTQVLPAALILGAHVTRPLGDGAALTLEGTNLSGTHYLSSIDRYGPPPSVDLRLRFGLGPQLRAAVNAACP